MSDVKKILDEQIRRVAKRESRLLLEPVLKMLAAQRQTISELRNRVKQLEAAEKFVSAAEEIAKKAAPDVCPIRFSGKMLTKMRGKMKLSQADFSLLAGVTQFTVSHWEAGKCRPRRAQLETIAALRKLGRREIAARLAALKPLPDAAPAVPEEPAEKVEKTDE